MFSTKFKMTDYKDAEWLEAQYIKNDRSKADIAEECDVCRRTISRWCNKFDIKRVQPAQFNMQTDDYEQWKCEVGPGKADTVLVHRLLATLKIEELSEMDGKEVHHDSRVPWDNRLDNLEVVSPQEHSEIHNSDTTEKAVP